NISGTRNGSALDHIGDYTIPDEVYRYASSYVDNSEQGYCSIGNSLDLCIPGPLGRDRFQMFTNREVPVVFWIQGTGAIFDNNRNNPNLQGQVMIHLERRRSSGGSWQNAPLPELPSADIGGLTRQQLISQND